MAEGLRGTDGRGRAHGILNQGRPGGLRPGDTQDQEAKGQGNPGPATARPRGSPSFAGSHTGGVAAHEVNLER